MQHVDNEMMNRLLDEAKQSDRKRAFYTFHTADESLNRMLVAGLKGSYAAPHRHTQKFEFFTYVHGDLIVLEFNDDGSIKNAYDLSKCPYVEVQPMTWHAVLFTSDTWAFMEMALWPTVYDPSDKEFASWAPSEGDPDVEAYIERLASEASVALRQ